MSRGNYSRKLSVSTPDGDPIYVIVTPGPVHANLEVGYLEAVVNDDPPFANNGVIRFKVPREGIKAAYQKITDYLESAFLKEIEGTEIDETVYTSLGAKPNSGRNKKSAGRKSNRKVQGEGDSPGVHSGARREELATSVSIGDEATPINELAEGDDSKDSGEDQVGD